MRLLLSLVTLLSTPLLFAAVNCDTVVAEMEKMRQAQQAVVISLAGNHEAFASVMEETTASLELYSKRVPAKALTSMNRTARSFRARGVKGKHQAEQLDMATTELIGKVAACLKEGAVK